MAHMEISSDYTEDDRWDWDREDPRQYCHHNRFIGSWWGPDILCLDCEMGYDPSLKDMVEEIDLKIRNTSMKMEGASEVLFQILDDVKGKDESEFIKKLLVSFNNLQNKNNTIIENLRNDRAKLIAEMEPFCEDWDDTSLLYNIHQNNIKEWKESNERSKNQAE